MALPLHQGCYCSAALVQPQHSTGISYMEDSFAGFNMEVWDTSYGS